MPADANNLSLWLAFLSFSNQATRDWLTGLYNRRYFEDALSDHIEGAKRYNRALSLAIFDLDNFKQINDEQGHGAGDEVLRKFAGLLKQTARKADIACRYGGDEFAVILPETGKENAERFAKRVIGGAEFPVTVGIAALPGDDLFANADRDLLARKTASRL